MAAHLSYGRVNLNVLREAVRRELREFLDKCAGSKVRDRARRHHAELPGKLHAAHQGFLFSL